MRRVQPAPERHHEQTADPSFDLSGDAGSANGETADDVTTTPPPGGTAYPDSTSPASQQRSPADRAAQPDATSTAVRETASQAAGGEAASAAARADARDGADRSTLRGQPGPRRAAAGTVSTRDRLRAYIALTKPRIVELLLITTIPTMFLAAEGWPGLWLVVATLIGGGAAAGSANTFNMIFDRDIDRMMNRTRQRPLVTGVVSVPAATVFAFALGLFSVGWFALLVNWPSAWLSFAAILMYVVGYTLLLKRRTSQNIVWGGAAGCMPVLIGWSAVTGTLAWPALVLFGIIFFWTPPHYWPLSMRFRKDYARAEVPMLPVVASDVAVAWQILGYGVAMVATSLVLVPVASMTWVYAVIAAAAGAWFLLACVKLLARARQPQRGKPAAMKVFHASITYLTVVFVAVAVDPFLPL